MCTRRVFSAITKKTKYRRRPARVSTSTVNRSAAARPSQCASLQERLPRRALVPLGSRGDPLVVQDPLHRVPGDVVAEVGERAADPRVTPRRILIRHPYDEFGYRPGCHRPSPTPAGTAIALLGDQTPVPAENRVRRDDACHLTQDPPAEFLAAHRESPALGVGQTKRSRTKMLPEDAILLPEIVDAIFLVASHPARQGQHEEMQSVGHGRRLHASDTAVTHVVSGIHAPRPFSRTIQGQAAILTGLGACPEPVGSSRSAGSMRDFGCAVRRRKGSHVTVECGACRATVALHAGETIHIGLIANNHNLPTWPPPERKAAAPPPLAASVRYGASRAGRRLRRRPAARALISSAATARPSPGSAGAAVAVTALAGSDQSLGVSPLSARTRTW